MPWQTMPRSRVAVTRGSFCRSEPAAALRGLANTGLPASVIETLSRSNASVGRNTSPRTSTSAGTGSSSLPVSRCGTESIVFTLGVTSSPVRPSPRVSARTSRPSSYKRLMASPSTLSSHSRSGSFTPSRSSRAYQDWSSSSLNALSRLSIGRRWSTAVNSVETAPPTFWVGESGVRSSGHSSSSACSRRSRTS